MTRFAIAIVLQFAVLLPAASAHYLFVEIESKEGEHGQMNLYFEEAPRPGDGGYLDPFIARSESWLRTAGAEAVPVKLNEVKVEEKNQRWLSGPLPGSGPRAVESTCVFGVYRYGQTDVLLNYYAKCIEAESAEQLKELGRSDKLRLEIRPTWSEGELRAEVLWEGKPAADTAVFLRGAAISANVKTDAAGIVVLKPEKPGRYTLRAYYQEPGLAGTYEGKEYSEVRHHSSLTIHLPIGEK